MKLKAEDICYELEILFNIVGEEKYLEIARMYGGTSIYIPKYSSVIRNNRNREIAKRYNGINARQLSREYGLTADRIRKIADENKDVN